MGKYQSRVGQVSLRARAITASLYAEGIASGVKTVDVAVHQGITTRRALVVMRYAEQSGWVHGLKSPHRSNAFFFRWLVSKKDGRLLREQISVMDRLASQALVSAYFWGRNEAL